MLYNTGNRFTRAPESPHCKVGNEWPKPEGFSLRGLAPRNPVNKETAAVRPRSFTTIKKVENEDKVNKMIKNRKVAVALTIAGGAMLLASLVSAQTTASPSVGVSNPPNEASNYKIDIGPKGAALLRGKVTFVAPKFNWLTLQSWGGRWTINVSPDSKIVPKVTGNISDLSKFSVGDQVEVEGRVAADQSWSIDAKVVRDKSIRAEERRNRESVQQVERRGMKETGRLFEGIAGNVAANSFTLTVAKNRSFAVNVLATSKVVNRNYANIKLTDVRSGDKVRVFGVASSSSISAEVVRDTSLPARGR